MLFYVVLCFIIVIIVNVFLYNLCCFMCIVFIIVIIVNVFLYNLCCFAVLFYYCNYYKCIFM